MKRILAVFLCVGMLLMPLMVAAESGGHATEQQTLTFAAMQGSYKTQGRTGLQGESLIVDHTAAGVEFNAYCTGEVTLAVTAKCAKSEMYFTVIVDGQRQRVALKNKGTALRSNQLTLAENLEEGVHTFAVYRQTEVYHGICLFDSLTLNGELLARPADSPLLIEFIGDSITAGYGVYTDLPLGNRGAGDPLFEDGTVTYAYQTAQALGADLNVIATSGYGVVHGWGDDAVMPKMYPYTSWWRSHSDPAGDWAFERTADVVVVNLGTNDAGTSKIGDTFTSGAKAFLETIREKNPEAKIVWTLGMMGATCAPQVQEAIGQLGGRAAGYEYVQLPSGQSGLNGHPNAEQHTKAAATLTAFLKQLLPEQSGEQKVTADELLALADGRTDETAQLARLTAAGGGVDNAALINSYYAQLRQSDGVPAWQWAVMGVCGVVILTGITVIIWVLTHRRKKET